ncbi:YveK family protein [Paenibacillus abyssi]|uniref:Capsular polysaccharide biosynthesis protein n=1 Tax=Paenibacillus abyssi TaxID=1340531 RepID=A0A917LGQ2_9BACL|nr:Wzz/FepE/Etk N-terminal domain-containing protein [Paenibacillus abyssi]GGG21766.1 capsular polysaccharide biosynthesis protein [Paenibacillus abyssi]
MELKQYMKIIQKKLWLIAAIVLIACLGTAVKSFYFTTPIYEANAKLIVNQTVQNNELTVGAVQTNVMLINSYKEIIQSAAIMDKVIEQHPEFELTREQLASNITVSSANNSQVMNLSYTDASYEKAANIVNAVSNVFKEQIPTIMKIDNVTILNEANVNDTANPINISPIMNILIGFVVALMMALGLVFLLDYLDDTIKSEAELEEALGIPMLALVTKMNKEDLTPKHKETVSQKKVGESKYATINQ